ncbi:DUF2254 domain-containing protein [Curtobacterium sp. SP.BCp]|uniref:DUF2254 domain-containing protein n=1 Tax=Curtobacterium sp. SP.BCp TaxID=3435230 RepID=UPI003F73FBEA
MQTLFLRIRESFWFVPAITGIAAVVVAELLVLLDRTLIDGGTRLWFLDALSASGGRSILTTIGTAMLTVAGTSFSITISVLATTSSTYGPRLVRNFMTDRANQFVLAAFTATFLYAIVVLRSVHTAVDDGDAFVPVIAIHVAVLLGVLDVAVLVFFIHHIASSTQITSLQEQVQTDLKRAVQEVYRSEETDSVLLRAVPPVPPAAVELVETASKDGYVQSVQWEQVRAWAANRDARVVMAAMPGQYVITGDPVFRVFVPDDADAAVLRRQLTVLLRNTVSVGSARTPHQDVLFALQQLVEIAVRGLASGSNDPYTAVSALDMSATALVPLWREQSSITAYTDRDGAVRVVPTWPAAEELISMVFAGVRTYGMEHPIVVDAARRLGQRLEECAAPDRRGHVAGLLAQLEAQR